MTIKSVWKVRAGNLGAASKWLNQTTGTSDDAPGLISNFNDDASVTDLATTTPDTFAGNEFAAQNVVSYHGQFVTNPIAANVALGWGAVGESAIAQGCAAVSAASGSITDYKSTDPNLHPTSAAQLPAFLSPPALDPTVAGTQSGIATAEVNALSLLGGDPSVDGSVGLNSSLSWPWNSPSFLASDAPGILEHVIWWNSYFANDGVTVNPPFETPVDVAARADAVCAPSVAANSFSNSIGSGDHLVGVVTEGAGIAPANVLAGNSGNSVLNSLVGADSMALDAGNGVAEEAGGGTGLVQTTLSTYTPGLDAENLTFIGADHFTGVGNTLIDGSRNNTLDGGAGIGSLIGNASIGTLTGDAGTDQMTGGTGDGFSFFSVGFGQDLLDIRDFGVTAAFASSVTRAGASGGSTMVTTGDNSINLAGVNVDSINATDFRFAPSPISSFL